MIDKVLDSFVVEHLFRNRLFAVGKAVVVVVLLNLNACYDG